MKKRDKPSGEAALHPDQKFVVERIRRSQIKNASYNPRQIDDHARKKLAGNIATKGLLDTLVWNRRTGNLVSGHQRLGILDERASKKGLDDYLLDVAVVDLSLEDERNQNVFFNNPSVQGTYDDDALGTMLANDEIDYVEAGFDAMDLQLRFEDTEYDVMFDKDSAPGAVQRDIDEISKIQRMKRERKEHRERDIDANDPEFYAVVVFPNREAQGRFMESVGMQRSDRYVDGVRVRTALEASKPRTRTEGGEEFEAMTFWVASDQKKVIEDELVRLGALLKGRNVRGRALEAMAVVSSQTEIENVTGEAPDEPEPKKKRKVS